MKNIIFVLIALLVLFSSCRVLTPISWEMLEKEALEKKLDSIQFFTGNAKLTLQRVVTGKEQQILPDGSIVSKKNTEIKEIVFKKNTMGIFQLTQITSSGIKMKILFEDSPQEDSTESDESCFLTFKVKNKKDLFTLSSFKKGDKVCTFYGENVYQVITETDESLFLLVDKRQLNQLKVSKRKASGISVGGGNTTNENTEYE